MRNADGDVAARLGALVRGLRDAASELEALLPRVATRTAPATAEQYLSLNDLCERVPYRPQTIRNLMNAGELRKDVHYVQRTTGGKLLFIWSAMERWLRERQLDRAVVEPFIPEHHARTRKVR